MIQWIENTVRTSALKCDNCKTEVGIGKIAIELNIGKKPRRLCKKCGEETERK